MFLKLLAACQVLALPVVCRFPTSPRPGATSKLQPTIQEHHDVSGDGDELVTSWIVDAAASVHRGSVVRRVPKVAASMHVQKHHDVSGKGNELVNTHTDCPSEQNQGHTAIYHERPHRSWDSDVWGVCVPDGLPDHMYENSVLIDGRQTEKGPSLQTRFASKLTSGRCLHVVALGGSGTIGGFAGNIPSTGSDHRSPRIAWPARLAEWLNHKFPCEGKPAGAKANQQEGQHIVTNLGERSMGSNHWADMILEWKVDDFHPIRQADLIIIEACLNDRGMDDFVHTGDKDKTIHMYTELIARQLLQLPNSPELMWAELLWLPGTSISRHHDVLSYYHLAQVSAFHAFSVLDVHGQENISQNEWLKAYYFWDIVHPSLLGQRLAAQLVGHSISMTDYSHRVKLLGTHGADARAHASKVTELAIGLSTEYLDKHATYVLAVTSGVNLPPPKWISTEMDNAYLHGAGISFELSSPETVKSYLIEQVGFDFKEDVKDKPGLIAMRQGSFVLFGARLPGLGKVRHKIMVTLGLLKSYEKMGVLDVRFSSTPSRNGQCIDKDLFYSAAPPRKSGAPLWKSVDCKWRDKVSVYATERFQVLASEGHECLWMKAEVAANPRELNKIKLLRLVTLVL